MAGSVVALKTNPTAAGAERLAQQVAIRRDIVHLDAKPAASDTVYPGAGMTTARLMILANSVVGEAFGVEALYLRGRRRGARRLAHAKQLAMALVHLVCGRSQEDVAKSYKRNRTTASHHMEMVEALNECPEHEAFWDLLVQRYELLIQLMSLPSGRSHWMAALKGLDNALDEGELEGQAVDQAKHVIGVFWEDRCAASA